MFRYVDQTLKKRSKLFSDNILVIFYTVLLFLSVEIEYLNIVVFDMRSRLSKVHYSEETN